MKEIIININDENDYVKVTKVKDNLKETKYTTIKDLTKIITEIDEYKKVKTKGMEFSSQLFPSTNGVTMLQEFKAFNGSRYVVLKKEACNHDFLVYDDTFEKVGLPILIFVLIITNNIIANGYVYACSTSNITKDTKLSYYPFPNVSSNGLICFGYGNSQFKKVEELSQLHSFPSKFFFMPSTHEMATRYNSKLSLRKVLENLSNKPFDYSLLKDNGLTYRNMIFNITGEQI